MKKKILVGIGVALVVCLVLFGGIQLYCRLTDPIGYRNYRICNKLPQGITAAQLKTALGEPMYRRDMDGEVWLYFKTLSIIAGPIRAQISDSDGKVLRLRCSEDGPDTWSVE